jgi:hypothetical protein
MHAPLRPSPRRGMASAMIRSAARRACSLALMLALLVAPLVPGAALEHGCTSCRPGCPMHAKRLGCHHAKDMHCHHGGASNGIRNACSQAPDPATPASAAARGVMPGPARVSAAFSAHLAAPRPRVLSTQHVPEPATDPPKAPRALS